MNKTNIDFQEISEFIKNKFGIDAKIEAISSGEFSQAFFINSNLVLRLNSNNDLGFQKDKIVNEQYPDIKTSKIIELGKFNDKTFFSISERIEGSAMREMRNDINKKLIPSLFEIMNTIHLSNVKGDAWGNWFPDLQGQFKDWKERMDLYIEKDKWLEMKDKYKFFEIDYFEELHKEYSALIKFVPKQRYFLHGDFGRSNIFANNNEITGIIDWSEAMYGDFLWDLAWVDFWADGVDFVQEYYEFNKNNTDLSLLNFSERIKLYRIVQGIHHMIFAAERNDEETYNSALNILAMKSILEIH